MFKDKTLLITGGTGSFGNAVLNKFLDTDIGEIRIFSRDEPSLFMITALVIREIRIRWVFVRVRFKGSFPDYL